MAGEKGGTPKGKITFTSAVNIKCRPSILLRSSGRWGGIMDLSRDLAAGLAPQVGNVKEEEKKVEPVERT